MAGDKKAQDGGFGQLDLFTSGYLPDETPSLVEQKSAGKMASPPLDRVPVFAGLRGAEIKDAGAELVYNRRNRTRSAKRWEDVSGLNDALKVREVIKANVWPKPDYALLIADGIPPLIANIVKQVYDSVAVVPVPVRGGVVDDALLQRYITGINQIHDATMRWADDANAMKQFAVANLSLVGGVLGQRVSLGPVDDNLTLYSMVFPGGWKAHREVLMVVGGNKVMGALQPGYSEIKKALKAIREGWPAKREAWQVQGFRISHSPPVKVEANNLRKDDSFFVSVDGRYVRNFDTQSEADEAAALIKPFVLFGKRGFLASFASEDEAVMSARERAQRDRGTQISDKGVRVETAQRLGVDRRMEGEDISSERLMDEFGLKGVNLGNWMKTPGARAEAQLHLNHAYDAFHDLADVLGLPPKAMSLGGMLGLAIGAQGSGGAHAAHFVPGVNEINLTRTSGAGSLAHEWAHALDHYFAVQAGMATATEPFLTEYWPRQSGRIIAQTSSDSEGTRPLIIKAFASIVRAMNEREQTFKEVQDVRVGRLKEAEVQLGSWLDSIKRDFKGAEAAFDAVAARIRLGDVGDGKIPASSSTYLSPAVIELREIHKATTRRLYSLDNCKAVQAWIDSVAFRREMMAVEEISGREKLATQFSLNARALDKDKGGKPYWGTNLEKFARAFDAFVSDAIEAKHARNDYLSHTGREGKTVPMDDERVAVNAAFQSLMSSVEVRAEGQSVALFSHAAPASGRTMAVADIHAEINRLRGHWKAMPHVSVVQSVADLPFAAPINADGVYCDGRVYVVACNVVDKRQLQKVMAHECIMHHGIEEMLGHYGFSKLHHGLQRLKTQGDPTVLSLAENIRSRYGVLPPEIETKEMVARAGEQCLDEKGDLRISFGFMKGVFSGIASWLRDHGISIPFTHVELQGIMHNAGEWIKREEPVQRWGEIGGLSPNALPLHSFAGVRAETAPLHTLKVAREMALSGSSDREIWQETGWTFGFADGKARFEISDDMADVVVHGRSVGEVWLEMVQVDPSIANVGQFMQKYPDHGLTAEVNVYKGVRPGYASMATDDPATAREIENYLVHESLYAAYPQLGKVKAARPLGISGLINSGQASFVPDRQIIRYSGIDNPDQFKSTTLHELQHAIQDIEGFARGGSPEQFRHLDITNRALMQINEKVHAIYDSNYDFYHDVVQANQLQLAMVEKYGAVNRGNPDDVLMQQYWDAVDKRNAHAVSNDWFDLKNQERNIAAKKIVMTPHEQYSRLAGEVEARTTQARLDMSDAERRADYPLDDMDTPVPSQVVTQSLATSDLVDSGLFVGKILDVAHGVVTQRVGRAGEEVRHLVAHLSAPVEIGDVVEVRYAQGLGQVSSHRGRSTQPSR